MSQVLNSRLATAVALSDVGAAGRSTTTSVSEIVQSQSDKRLRGTLTHEAITGVWVVKRSRFQVSPLPQGATSA